MNLNLDDEKVLDYLKKFGETYESDGNFLSSTHEQKVRELFKEKKDKVGNATRTVIPVGIRLMMIKSIDVKQKSPTHFYVEIECVYKKDPKNKKLYMPLYLEYDINYKDKANCDARGVPNALLKLRKFYYQAFGFEIQNYKEFYEMLVVQLDKKKGQTFLALIRETKKLDRRGEKIIISKQYYGGRNNIVPKLIWGAVMVSYGKTDDTAFRNQKVDIWKLIGVFSKKDKEDFKNVQDE